MFKKVLTALLAFSAFSVHAAIITINVTGNSVTDDPDNFQPEPGFCCSIPIFEFEYSVTFDSASFDTFNVGNPHSEYFEPDVLDYSFTINGQHTPDGFHGAGNTLLIELYGPGSPNGQANYLQLNMGSDSSLSPHLGNGIYINYTRTWGGMMDLYNATPENLVPLADALVSNPQSFNWNSDFLLRDAAGITAWILVDVVNVEIVSDAVSVSEPSSIVLLLTPFALLALRRKRLV